MTDTEPLPPRRPTDAFPALLKAAAEALIAPTADAASVAAALGGRAEGAGPRFTIAAPDPCLHSASLFLPGGGTATVTLAPAPGAAPTRAALEAALGPAQEMAARPEQFDTYTLTFDYPGPAPERFAAVNADFPVRPPADGAARAISVKIIRQRPRPAPAPARKPGLLARLRR